MHYVFPVKAMNIYCSVNNQTIKKKKPADSARVGMFCNFGYYYSIIAM